MNIKCSMIISVIKISIENPLNYNIQIITFNLFTELSRYSFLQSQQYVHSLIENYPTIYNL